MWGLHTVELREEEVQNYKKLHPTQLFLPEIPANVGAKHHPHSPPLKQAARRIQRVPITQGDQKLDPHQQQLPPDMWELLPFSSHTSSSTFQESRASHTHKRPTAGVPLTFCLHSLRWLQMQLSASSNLFFPEIPAAPLNARPKLNSASFSPALIHSSSSRRGWEGLSS